MNKQERIHIFVQEIWQWYNRHKRELPWRDLSIEDDTQRAYHILVSEVMLQQTQVPRVKIKFKEFLHTFPTLESLAQASNKDVILAWQGMGYNNRVIRLRDAAKTIVNEYDGVFPKEMEALIAIKGIGHYTAAAVRNFAFGLPTACLDTNIRRILHRTFFGPENPDGTYPVDDKKLVKLAEEVLQVVVSLVPLRQAQGDTRDDTLGAILDPIKEWHAALMDFGSLVCTKKSPKWDICPLTKAGVMKAAYKVKLLPKEKRQLKKEPGRMVGSKFIPNRIFRGKIVEELRQESNGLTLNDLGRRICIDWNKAEHQEWLGGLLQALEKDEVIRFHANLPFDRAQGDTLETGIDGRQRGRREKFVLWE